MSALKGADSEKLAIHRQLKIKVGAVKRLLKEHNLYRKEAEDQERKLDRMVTASGEEWDIKNAKRILEESQRMIKDSGDRLEKVIQESTSLIDSVKSRPEFSGDNELVEAEKVLAEARATPVADKVS